MFLNGFLSIIKVISSTNFNNLAKIFSSLDLKKFYIQIFIFYQIFCVFLLIFKELIANS